MRLWAVGGVLFLGLAACEADFDSFRFDGDASTAGAAGSSGATGAAGSATGGTGGTGGSGGSAGNGTGGTAGSAGSAGASGGSAGNGGCGPLDAPENCGACGNDCTGQGLVDGFSCVSGTCGCTDSNQCGSMTGVCQSGTCECASELCNPGESCVRVGDMAVCGCNGSARCSAGEVCCPTGCADLDSDAAHCGTCGNACPGGESCSNGSCS